MQCKGTTKGPHGHRGSVPSERYQGIGRQHRRKVKDSLVVKIKLRQGFANGSFPSGFVFQDFPLFFLSHSSLFSFKKYACICISKYFQRNLLSLKVHGRFGLLFKDKLYAAFIPAAHPLKLCMRPKGRYPGSTADLYPAYNTEMLYCSGVTTPPPPPPCIN